MTDKIKVFYALCPAIDHSQQLWQELTTFRQQYPDQIHWVTPRNYHVTIKFLGFIPAKKISNVIISVQQAISQLPAPMLEYQKIVPFPNHIKPRVIAALIKPHATLQQLFDHVDEVLSSNGFREERRAFLPHLTVARIRNFNCPDFSPEPLASARWQAAQLTLLQSISTKHDILYLPLAQIPLRP